MEGDEVIGMWLCAMSISVTWWSYLHESHNHEPYSHSNHRPSFCMTRTVMWFHIQFHGVSVMHWKYWDVMSTSCNAAKGDRSFEYRPVQALHLCRCAVTYLLMDSPIVALRCTARWWVHESSWEAAKDLAVASLAAELLQTRESWVVCQRKHSGSSSMSNLHHDNGCYYLIWCESKRQTGVWAGLSSAALITAMNSCYLSSPDPSSSSRAQSCPNVWASLLSSDWYSVLESFKDAAMIQPISCQRCKEKEKEKAFECKCVCVTGRDRKR